MSKAGTSKATGRKGGRAATGEGPVKVLLAEDEESFIEALVIGLTNEGFRVTVARDGNEALQLFDETVPDILLLDLMLPKLSGIDVCRAIRTRSQVPIIMVTAKGTEIDTVVGSCLPAPSFTIVPAHDALGSNAVLCAPPGAVPLRFGDDSYFPHLAAARRAGIEPTVVRLPGIALDIDHPADLRMLLRAPRMPTRTGTNCMSLSWGAMR